MIILTLLNIIAFLYTFVGIICFVKSGEGGWWLALSWASELFTVGLGLVFLTLGIDGKEGGARWAYYYMCLANVGFYLAQLNYNDDCFLADLLIMSFHGWLLTMVASWANQEDE